MADMPDTMLLMDAGASLHGYAGAGQCHDGAAVARVAGVEGVADAQHGLGGLAVVRHRERLIWGRRLHLP